jgi:hypothetical protein
MISETDIEKIQIDLPTLKTCIDIAQQLLPTMIDRANLHDRDDLEKFLNLLMGEIAEQAVLGWFLKRGKWAASVVDKKSGIPDAGHDLELISINQKKVRCSIKSSFSFAKQPSDIIKQFKLATTPGELREINIQVYFWIDPFKPTGQPRKTLPSLTNCAIIGWFAKEDLVNQRFTAYNGEMRAVPVAVLENARSMNSLLSFIQ